MTPETAYSHVPIQLAMVQKSLADAARRYHRDPAEITLLAVSKTFPADAIQVAYACGQRCFGESRIRELEEKQRILPTDIQWHFIGHLQSNKVAKVVALATMIHSVDTVKLLEKIDAAAATAGKRMPILLELNVSGEASKFGETDTLAQQQLMQAALAAKHVDWQGFMTMAPATADEAQLDAVFGRLRDIRNQAERETGRRLPILSMGMSGDFVRAVADGSTLVRIGTAIFGKREYKL